MKRLLLLVAVCLGSAAPATGLVIDNFRTGACTLGREGLATPYTVSASQLDPGGQDILGGRRDVTLLKLTGSSTQPYVGIVPGDIGFASYNSSFGCNGVWTLHYDGGGALNVDLTHDGSDAVLVELWAGDLNDSVPPRPVPLAVTVVSGSGTATVTQQLQENRTYTFPFADFAGVDFHDVRALTFETTQDSAINDAVDFAFSAIGTGIDGVIAVRDNTWGGVKALYR